MEKLGAVEVGTVWIYTSYIISLLLYVQPSGTHVLQAAPLEPQFWIVGQELGHSDQNDNG